MRRWIGIGLILVLGAGAVVAAASTRADRPGTAAKLAAGDTAPNGGGVTGGAEGAFNATARSSGRYDRLRDESAKAAPLAARSNARVVKHATLELSIRRKVFDRRFASARGLADFLGGFVEQSEQTRSTASVALRIPAAQYGAALQRLRELGRVTTLSERGEDVTAQFVDLDARIRNLTAQEGVLQDLMSQARTIPDTISVQQQLSAVREQIEQLTGQRNLLDDQAAFATFSVTMIAAGFVPAPTPEESTLAAAWQDSVHVGAAVLGGTLVVAGALLPLALMAGLGLLIWTGIRRRRVRVHPAGA